MIVIDNLSNSFHSVLDRINLLASNHHGERGTKMPSLRLHAHDYRDTIALRQLLEGCQDSSRWGSPKSKIAGVIHFAGYKAVEESIREPLKYYANNVSGLIDFVTTLGDFGIKTFIHVTDLSSQCRQQWGIKGKLPGFQPWSRIWSFGDGGGQSHGRCVGQAHPNKRYRTPLRRCWVVCC